MMIREKKSFFTWLGVVLLLVFGAGCTSELAKKEDPFFSKWKEMAKNARGHSPAPKEPTAAMQDEASRKETEAKETLPPEKPLPDQLVSLKLHQADAVTVLRALARAANQNILVSNAVKGQVTVNMEKVPWGDAFRGILRTVGLTYGWEGDLIRVMTLDEMEHDLKIEAINEKRKSQDEVIKRVEPLMTRVIPISYANPTKLMENIQEFLTKDKEGKPRGSVKVNEHTNALVVQAIKDDQDKMISLVERLDKPTPQILIEANIVEANRETARELGVQWGGLQRRSSGDRSTYITPGASSQDVLGQRFLTDEGALNPINPTSGTAANFPADVNLGDPTANWMSIGYVAERAGRYILSVQLSALQSEGKLNILSSPSITTLDNQAAVIESGAEVPFQTVSAEGNIQIEWKKAVLKLEVTPHVIDGKILKMKILTHKDELDFTRTVQGNPTIITKKAETNLILLDGQTTVIGGLTKETTTKSEDGVPGMKDIPLL
ncbi:MAG: type IV pilus secretin PilQ, partial [Pseudomonadota bacterium]